MLRITTWAFVGLFVAFGIAAPASAQSVRTFVSGHGADTGNCALSTPCRTFAYALSQTASGGEILVLDSAGYGCGLTIAQSASIVASAGVSARMACSGGTAITVNGSNIDVTLEGLGVEGASVGVLFSSGRLLTMRNIEINGGTGVQHNAGNGVLSMSDSVLRNGGNCFIAQTGSSSTPAYATIVNSRAEGCYMGFLAHANSFVAISHSSAVGASSTNFNECYAAFIALGDGTGPGSLSLDDVVATTCYYGLAAAPLATGGTGTITFANSLVTRNNTGTAPFGTISTFGDNRVYGNVTENNGSLTPISPE